MNSALANIAIEQQPTASPLGLIETSDDMFDLNGICEPIISVPALESVKFAVPFSPPVKTIKKFCADVHDTTDMHKTTMEESCFEDVVVSDSDMSTSVIIIDE